MELTAGQRDWLLLPDILLLADGADIFLFGVSALAYLSEGRGGKGWVRVGFKLGCVPGLSADFGKCFETGEAISLLSPFSTGNFDEDNIWKRS